jgi:hypothetical protein
VAELGEQADELPASASPAEAFDAAWARSVIAEALQRMQRECAQSGRRVVWDLFHCRVVAPALEGTKPPAYEDLIARFQLSSPSQASNVLVTAKRMYVRVLRAVVAQYTRNEADIDAEINDLRNVLARGG